MARVAIVGAGVMGAATAWQLARLGHHVEIHEQFQVGHTHGSSHGRSRIVRLAYPEPEWVEFAEQAFAGWRELEAESGARLLELYGLLELVGDPATSSRDALEARGAKYELVDAEAARGRWPIGVPDGWTALFQPEAGIVRADLAWQAFLDAAVSRGAKFREHSRVDALAELDADVVVVTAGPWARRLLEPEGIDLPVRTTRETLAYFELAGPPLPSVVQLNPETRNHAMYSLHDPVHGLKAGAHHAGPETNPDEEGLPDPDLLDAISSWVGETYRNADPKPLGAETCVYTTTADESFVLERHGRVVVGSACSGHGFKFAPAVGERLAALATG
ncbi:MAG: sarcosine oxidase [Gaiellaceae bacterium]|nr:sarcosine oxidase [Gaiellaceae bacterium]